MQNIRILLTGGSNGLGAALVQHLNAIGADVYSIDLSYPETLIAGVHYIKADITNEESLLAAMRELPAIHILINNAGNMRRGTIFESTSEDFHALFSVHVRGSWLMLRHAPLVKDAMIVQISSVHALEPVADPGLYTLAKQTQVALAHLTQLTKPAYDVRVVCPGKIDTAMQKIGRSKKELAKITAQTLQPDVVAEKIVKFMQSDNTLLYCKNNRYLMR